MPTIKSTQLIRRYVRGLGVSEAKFDRVCIDFFKIGALPHIQGLHQRDPKIFLHAFCIAAEAESEKTVKAKPKAETVNHVAVTDNTTISTISEQLKELCALLTTQVHQSQYQRITQPPKYEKVDNGVRGVCYHCHKPGHSFEDCCKATDGDKEDIRTRGFVYLFL